MKELKTTEEVIEFAKEMMEAGKARVIEAHKPSGTFMLARQLDAPEYGTTWNREGKFEQYWTAEPGDWVVTAADKDGNALLATTDEDLLSRVEKVQETIERLTHDLDGMESGAFAYTKDGYDEESAMLANQMDKLYELQQLMHDNTYPMSNETFEEKYDFENIDERGLVEAKSLPQTFIVLDESVGVDADGIMIHQSWDQDEFMSQGAVLNVTKLDKGDVYGVDPVFFAENFKIDSVKEPTGVSKETPGAGLPSLDDLKARAQTMSKTDEKSAIDVADEASVSEPTKDEGLKF